MIIWEDTRQQTHHGDKHAVKHAWFNEHGVEIERRKLDFGDYMREGSNVSIDTKRSIDEVAANIGSSRGHGRFKRECERARDNGCALVILVENRENVNSIDDLPRWTNGHCMTCGIRSRGLCNPRVPGRCQRHNKLKPIQGPRLAKAMVTMTARYGVRFEFCRPKEAAQRICELLGVEYERDAEGR